MPDKPQDMSADQYRDYLSNITATNYSVQPGLAVGQKPRQAIKVDPTDDAHTTTHRAPE